MPGLLSCFSCFRGQEESNDGQPPVSLKAAKHLSSPVPSSLMPEHTRPTNASTAMMGVSEHSSQQHVLLISRQHSQSSDMFSCRESFTSCLSVEHDVLESAWHVGGKSGQATPFRASIELVHQNGHHQPSSTHPNLFHDIKPATKGHHAALQNALSRYREHKHPCEACQELLQYCNDAGISPKELEQLVEDMEDESAKVDLTRLVAATVSMQHCARVVLDDTGWEVVRDDALKMMYKHEPGSTVHGFKGRCTLDHPIEQVMATAREFDLGKTWNKYMLDSVVMREYSHSELLCCGVMWMPWPLHNATLVLEAVGADLLKQHGGFLVTIRTPKHVDPKLLSAIPLAGPKNLRIIAAPGSCLFFEPLPPLKPGGPQRTRATVEIYVDAGIKHVPHMLITFVLKVMGPFLYTMALKLLETEFSDPTKPIPSRIPQRPDLYGLIRDHSAAYLARNPRPASITGAGEAGAEGRHSRHSAASSKR